MVTSRTLGPLHFEDLDPKRFEDLVRQLAYEFKPWRKLEATGRSGSDDGFDARGYEIVATDVETSVPLEEGESVDEQAARTGELADRLWLIQCKRERAIGPKALGDYLNDAVLHGEERLHGLVFAAACDFSKKARDGFAEKCREMGLQEWHLWGKAELEDRLLRPENDHLLFAYFGVSLTIRRRSQRADVRARLAMKRKAHRMLKAHAHASMLLRSPEAIDYPDPGDIETFRKSPLWTVWPYRGMSHDGLMFCVERYFAFLADDGASWDAAMSFNDAIPHTQDDPWLGRDGYDEKRNTILKVWDAIPEPNKAWLEVIGVVAFDDILDIDDLGDDFVSAPHIYASFVPGKRGPFRAFGAEVETIGRWDQRSFSPASKSDGRIEYFPRELRQRDIDDGSDAA